MTADVHTMYESSFYRVTDFRCKCNICSTSKAEYQDTFCISYIRKGNFVFNVFRNALDVYSGQFLVSKPGFEHTVTHFERSPDQCTIFSFNRSFYESLINEYISEKSFSAIFRNNDIHSVLIKASAETEFLHSAIVKAVRINTLSRFLADTIVVELAHEVIKNIDKEHLLELSSSLKKYHLSTVENAKEFIHENFHRDISLFEVAENCFVSPFHFSRLFKKFTGLSPHQYLLETRLKNADFMLKHTELPVTQISYDSGFNNPDHFSTYFKKRYNTSPRSIRSLNK